MAIEPEDYTSVESGEVFSPREYPSEAISVPKAR